MICVTRKYSVENYVFFFDKVVVLGFDLVSGAITITSAPPCLIEERFSGHGCHTLYFYITTVVINEKKRSLDVLCIEIIIYVQNALFPQIFFLLNIFDDPNKKSGHPQTTFRTHSGMVPEKDRIQTGFRPESFKFWTQLL